MKNIKSFLIVLFLILLFTLAACSEGDEEGQKSNQNKNQSEEETSEKNMGGESGSHESMDHSGSSEAPESIKEAENPTYEIDSHAIIQADHMNGMEGAKATIVRAYDTVAYVVSYDPTNGGERVENHKWVVREEIEEAGEETYKSGVEVTLNASHMKGMEGAAAVIDSAEKTTVYMVDYTPTDGGDEVTNHKWVTESELTAD